MLSRFFFFISTLFSDALKSVFQVTTKSEMAKTGCQAMHVARQDTNLAVCRFYRVSLSSFHSARFDTRFITSSQ
ncbi:hypothetical protein EV702DRAFT_1110456 [Suillus placidus]|uniref:Secreted protein n=1 Tax=Suillus placidus TaxID=48579 RepID=A0A9P6ZUB5_9AGAM|nr:hypothetical protein EV702DRAFT_1110456 [Suillus placidus]